MILVDTSVWIDHLRSGNPGLVDLLNQGLVAVHPFVMGELACGNLRNREEILGLLAALPAAPMAEHQDPLLLLERERLYGRGLGWVDVHLVASALLMSGRLWTLDKPLAAASGRLDLEFVPG